MVSWHLQGPRKNTCRHQVLHCPLARRQEAIRACRSSVNEAGKQGLDSRSCTCECQSPQLTLSRGMPHNKAGQRVCRREPVHSLLDACAPRLVPLCIGVALAAAGAQEEDAAAAHVLEDALGLIHISINLQSRHVQVSGQMI